MNFENSILPISYPAGEDLSNDQYRFVVLDSTGVIRRPNAGTDIPLGILQNAPTLGQAAHVMVEGISKFEAGGALGVGALVMLDYTSATDAGKAVDSAGNLDRTRGIVLEASGAEGDLGTLLLTGLVPGITQAAAHAFAVATVATAGAATYDAADVVGGLILRDPNGASRSDVTPTAALLVAAVPGAVVGSGFEFTIRNTADAAETITLTAGSGVTLSGTMTIAQNNSKRFLAVITNVGTPAITIYSLGTVVH